MTEFEPVGELVEKGYPEGSRPVRGPAAAEWGNEEPIPVRYWWFKRIGLAVIMFVLILAGLRWWWGWEAQRRLQAEIDKIVAAGEPIFPQDFDPPELVPDDENAAKFLEDAEIALILTPDEGKLIDEATDDGDVLRERLSELCAIVERSAVALDLVRQARARTRVDWGIRIRTPAISFLLPPLSGQRTLSKLLSLATECRHVRGDDAAAVETLRDMLGQARATDSGPTLISHLVAIAMHALGSHRAEALAPALSIMEEAASDPAHQSPAAKTQVAALISEFLDESDLRRNFVRAMQSERMAQLDSGTAVAYGQLPPPWSVPVLARGPGVAVESIFALALRPLCEFDTVFALAWVTKHVDAARASNWREVEAVTPVQRDDFTLWERMVHPISSYIMMPWFKNAMSLHFRALAMRRMAAIALAIRMYEVDHGERPASLAELVPDYLPQVPLDPFVSDGRPISYRPDAKPPVLYSIGVDGVDDEGTFTFRYGDIDWEKLDLPFFLDGHRPKKPES